MSSKAKKILNGSALRVVDFFVTAFVALALTPFIIRSLGDNMYGLWIFVGSFLGYYGLMDFGLNSAIQRFLSRAIGSSNKDEESRIINTALAVFSIIGFAALLLSIALSLLLPMWIKNISDVVLFKKIIFILGLNFALGFPLRVFSGILAANIRYDISTGLELVKLALRTLLIIVLLKAGYGLIALAIIALITDIGGYLAKYFVVRSLYKDIVYSIKLIDRSMIRPLFGYSIYTFISQIAEQLKFNFDNLVIISFIGLNSVTVYSIAFRLVRYFSQFIGASIGVFVPVFSQYEARGDKASIREKFILSTKISGYMSVFIGCVLIIFGKSFINRWVGVEYVSAYPILVILTISFTISLMQDPSVQLFYGLSQHKYLAIISTIEGASNLLLSIILIKKIGLIGVALGTAIPMTIVFILVYPRYACRLIDLNIWKYYFHILFPTLIKGSLVAVVLWWFLRGHIYPNYMNLTVQIICFGILFSVSCFWAGFESMEKMYFKKIILKYI